MGRVSHVIVVVVIVSIINQSISVVPFDFVRDRNRNEDYKRSKSASSYRGLFLSYSPEQKNDICHDLFPSITQVETSTARTPTWSNDPVPRQQEEHPLLTATIVNIGTSEADEESIFFRCTGYQYDRKYFLVKKSCLLSFTFLPGFLYAAFETKSKRDGEPSVEVLGYIAMSPQYVTLNDAELEMRYVSVMRRLKVIESESPDYYRLIQTKYDLSVLSDWQKYLLCHSIVSSPIYKQDKVELVRKPEEFNLRSLSWKPKPLAFRGRIIYADERIVFRCIICKVTRITTNGKTRTNLYVTQSYDNKNSFYVMKVETDGIKLDKYFINDPVLMNVHDSTTAESPPKL